MSAEAKDIYCSNHYVDGSEKEYSTIYAQGERSLKKYINVIDYSLDSIKLQDVYERVYRKTDFSFKRNGKDYSDQVVNINFTYNLKEFNNLGADTYIRFGYNGRNCVFEDSVCIKDGQLVGIKTNVEVENPIANKYLGTAFTFKNGIYHKGKIKTLYSVARLRELLYKEGFDFNGIHFRRFKRSSGSSRVGKCLFINEKLYPRMNKWSMCGIKVNEGDKCDLASIEAYQALTLSSIIDTLEINKENILVIDDYESVFKDSVIATEIVGGELVTSEKEADVSNSIWDGQSLLDISAFGKYRKKGMLLLRNRFFKSACFNTNLQRWFIDNEIISVSQLNGFTLAKDVSQIKLITTPSSIKYLKFGKIEDWLSQLESLFGVVKYDKPTGRFKGDKVQIHYQLLNTLQLNEDDVYRLVKPTLDSLEAIKNEPAVLKHYIQYPENKRFEEIEILNKNEIIYNMLSTSQRFFQTKLYHDFKVDLLRSQIKAIRCGHIYVKGNYSTLFGNPIEMLEQAIGRFDGASQMGKGNIYNTMFAFDQTLLGSRSPHIANSASLLAYNKQNELIEKYFYFTNELVAINSIGENILERLSGADFDSDTILLTNDSILIKAASKNYDNFKVPTSMVEAKKIDRHYTDAQKADLDVKTSVNKIGEIVNLSQELNSQLWDRIHAGESIEDVRDLYYDISKLSTMSGIEIDKAKKEFLVDTVKEMRKIKEKNIKRSEKYAVRPYFFKILSDFKGYPKKSKSHYRHFDTPMDYLQEIVEEFVKETKLYRKMADFIPFSDVVSFDDYDYNKIDWWQTQRIFESVYRYKSDSIRVWSSDADYGEKMLCSMELKAKCVEYIGKIKMNKSTMLYLLKAIETPQYSNIRRFLFDIFFASAHSSFFGLIKYSQETPEILVKSDSGNISFFGDKYAISYKFSPKFTG